MSLISLVGVLIVIGVLLWLINTYLPMDGKISRYPERRRRDRSDYLAASTFWRCRFDKLTWFDQGRSLKRL